MKKILLFMVAILYALLPVWAEAAFNDVTTSDNNASITLTNDGSSYTVDNATRVESFTVNASTIDFVVNAGSIIYLKSADRKNFTYTSGTCVTNQITCSSDQSTLYIQCDNQASSQTITVTPSGTCTTSSGGGSSGGGGGGGGGSSAPKATETPKAVTPVVPTTPTTPAKIEPKAVSPVVESKPVEALKPAVSASYQFKKQFGPGSRGEDVKQLQMKLKELGYLPASTKLVDNFGPSTTAAVKKFQKAKGISQVGNVGNATLKALNALSATSVLVPSTEPAKTAPVVTPAPVADKNAAPQAQFKRNLSMGSKGADVIALQESLRAMGYFTYPSNTGTFGSATRDAVKKFQKAKGISQVGNVGPATLKALNSL